MRIIALARRRVLGKLRGMFTRFWLILTALLLACLGQHAHAQLRWDKTDQEATLDIHDKGVVRDFTFQNTGKKPVTILSVQSSCDCTVGKLDKKVFAPGETGALHVHFTVRGQPGEQEKNIVVKTDAATDALHWLTFRVNVPPLATLAPEKAEWTVGQSAGEKTVTITFAPGISVAVTDIKASANAFDYTLREVKKGSVYQLRLKPRSTANAVSASFRLETNFPPEAPRVLLVPAEIN